MKKLALGIACALLLGAVGVTFVLADPAPAVNAHRHYILNGNGDKVYVGPDFCGNEALAQGFAEFHAEVHRGHPALKAFQNPNNPVVLRAEGC